MGLPFQTTSILNKRSTGAWISGTDSTCITIKKPGQFVTLKLLAADEFSIIVIHNVKMACRLPLSEDVF